MRVEIKCLECGKRTRNFELGPAAYSMEGGGEIILRDEIVCSKCGKNISHEKCVALGGEAVINLTAWMIAKIAEKEGMMPFPPHLRDMIILSKEDCSKLKKQSKGVVKLVTSFREAKDESR